MVSFTSIAFVGATLLSSTFAAPTATYNTPAAAAVAPAGATHTVAVGRAGLHFDPENIVAEVGDIVEFHYLAKNHSVAQSSFVSPCVPLTPAAFFSGFMPTAEGTQNPDVFQVVVKDTKPVWFYCSQTAGSHCQMGMAGVINQDFNTPNTLGAYKARAAGTGTSISPPYVGGGLVELNPNPLSGL